MAEKITISDAGVCLGSDQPVIPFIEGDGTGVDTWPADEWVLDAAGADDIVRALQASIADKIVTYDFARLMEGVTTLERSELGAAVVECL